MQLKNSDATGKIYSTNYFCVLEWKLIVIDETYKPNTHRK